MGARMREIEAVVGHYLSEWGGPAWAHAFHELIELGPSVLPEIEPYFRSGDASLRAELVVIARHLHSDQSLSLFTAALGDRAPEVWKAALDGLVELASPEAIRVLEEALEGPADGTNTSEWRSWVREALEQAREARARLSVGDTA
jgi:HEAT repeat protein